MHTLYDKMATFIWPHCTSRLNTGPLTWQCPWKWPRCTWLRL